MPVDCFNRTIDSFIRVYQCFSIVQKVFALCILNKVISSFDIFIKWICLYSYWTDNGACYYYDTIKFPNYEDALVAVKEQADKDGIPFRYLQVCVCT